MVSKRLYVDFWSFFPIKSLFLVHKTLSLHELKFFDKTLEEKVEEEEDEADLYDHKYEQIDCFQGTMRVLNICLQMSTEKKQ